MALGRAHDAALKHVACVAPGRRASSVLVRELMGAVAAFRRVNVTAFVVAAALAACGGESQRSSPATPGAGQGGTAGGALQGGVAQGGTAGVTAEGGSAGSSACAWPAEFDRTDLPRGSCRADRAVLECTQVICLSDSLDACPGSQNTGTDCTNVCNAAEYGLECVSPDPSSVPSGCRSTEPPIPGGLMFFCCPCGGDAAGEGAAAGAAQEAPPSCDALAAAYANVVAADTSCDPASPVNQCVTEVGSSVPCRCPTPATTTQGIDAAFQAYSDAGCEPPDVRCGCPFEGVPPYACSSEGVCGWGPD